MIPIMVADMYYYGVLPADASYKGSDPLTYQSEKKLLPGQFVRIALRKKITLGIISKVVEKPSFTVKAVVEVFEDLPRLPIPSRSLMCWVASYYASPIGSVVQLFIPRDLKTGSDIDSHVAQIVKSNLPPLTTDQSKILADIKLGASYLLHGDTGTGKTRVYIEVAKRSLDQGLSSLILTPEISLTSQLAREFSKTFGDKVLIIHSKLTPKERRAKWLQILCSTQSLIVIGPRSALFSPFQRLGLVVVDESHEAAYKQEQMPYYHANRVGSKLASLHQAIFIMGSATPSINDYFLAEQKNVPILRMDKLALTLDSSTAKITVVDLTDTNQTTRSPFISNTLIKGIEEHLAKGQQSLLFLNRRGTARAVICENCGWHAVCPRCDLPLTYHGDNHMMQCHTCGFRQAVVNTCPVCHEQRIVYKGAGTKAIVEVVQKLFPQARVQRFDTDNKKTEAFEKNFEKVHSGEVDIVVGTQTIAKGLDLPRLSLVGIIVAETGLSFPDYTASEKTYQLITQVIGRIGRGHLPGEAIIQTYNPENKVLQAALKRDWKAFYQVELNERRRFMFPPFCHVLKLSCVRASSSSAKRAAVQLAEVLSGSGLAIDVSAPTASFYEKVDGKYRWQIIVKTQKRVNLVNIVRKYLPSGWSYDIDPINLL